MKVAVMPKDCDKALAELPRNDSSIELFKRVVATETSSGALSRRAAQMKENPQPNLRKRTGSMQ